MKNANFSYFWGVFVPALILIFSVLVTVWLYRLFSKNPVESSDK